MLVRISFLLILAAVGVVSTAAQENCPQPDKDGNRAVCIYERPRVGYTDEARSHRVSGTIIVSAEFLADGTIGAVVWINPDVSNAEDLLKYGLVQNTLDAARRIKFLPELKKGAAVTVTKRLEYSFSIY